MARRPSAPPPLTAFAVLAAVDVAAVAADLRPLEWLVKPLLAPVLALHLWRRTGARRPFALAGLGLAAAGDAALLAPGAAAFAAGLALFLGAQICWSAEFLRAGALRRLRSRRLLSTGYLVAWAAAVAVLAPSLGPWLGLAVAVYALALLTMALTAWALGRRAACGGLVFLASDLLVGLGAARLDFPGRAVAVMATYATALFLLVTAFAADDGIDELRPLPDRAERETAPEGSAVPARRRGAVPDDELGGQLDPGQVDVLPVDQP
ncbi:lysoplasmalogenase family protein [Streptomyces sp. NPDC046985]|uniref:lysoplasmalogenase family protein n=1 Tax=Streptomyces sp. NPDC046985 TaxID=3155377 RepID=UPI0033DEA5CD